MRFVIDTSVIIGYLRRDDAASDAVIVASRRGKVAVSIVSLMELCPAGRKARDIELELEKVDTFFQPYRIQIITCTDPAQRTALSLAKTAAVRQALGKNVLTDALIIGCGIGRRAYLLTRDKQWSRVSRFNKRIRAISPEQLLQQWA